MLAAGIIALATIATGVLYRQSIVRPEGAEIRYITQQADFTSAIHDWFAAQRSDHGHHAH